jgi:hypothetical protein
VRFEVPYDEPPSCGYFLCRALFFSRRLRRRGVLYHHSGSHPNAYARAGSESNANSKSNAGPRSESKSNAHADAGAVRSIGNAVMVGEQFERCGKLQRLPIISIYWALHKNWQCH